jgi:GT2 family glycosyltransferase
MKTSKVYIITVNYKTCRDTIECLESVFKSTYPDFQVIVVNNNAYDDDMKYMLEWASGAAGPLPDRGTPIEKLSNPPCAKPLPHILYDRLQAEAGGIKTSEEKLKNPVIFIDAGRNGGYAAGNNIGIKYALAKGDFEYVWLLNNDTVVEKESLALLVEAAGQNAGRNLKFGMTGPKLRYYHNPGIINGVAGLYNRLLGVGKLLGAFQKDTGQFDRDDIVPDYVPGAAMLAGRDFITDTGLLNEEYFLYFEEIDWAIRGAKKGYGTGYCYKSVVYHKEGASVGSSSKGGKKSELADYYSIRNRIVFTKKYFSRYLPFLYASMALVILNRILRGQFSRVKMILGILSGKGRPGL